VSERSFRELLREYRRAQGLTQQELAERAGVSARSVSDLERGLKLRPHRHTVELLANALGLDPPARRELESSIRRTRGDPGVATESTRQARNNLPHPASSFLGRETEVAQIVSLLTEEGARLLTLTGPGGAGKTRLALRAAVELLTPFSDGVFFVNLSPITDAALVPSSIARAVGVMESAGVSLEEALEVHLADSQLLLVLDNFEQVLGASPLISRLLAACGLLKVLVTSRRVLHLSGEFEMVVPPLSLPERSRREETTSLAAYEAVALFEQRARASRLDFRLSSENGPAVAEICTRLDGLPLAIELAAVHVRTLRPQAILSRLSHRLDMLRHGPVDVPERHRALRATMDWSYELLEEPQRRLFARLAIFGGGFTVEAAEAICCLEDDGRLDMLQGIEELRDNSLLQVEPAERGQTRYALLETIREYAAERLHASGEEPEIAARHTAWFRELAGAAGRAIRRSRDPAMLEVLEAEQHNIRLALERAVGSGDIETAGAVAAAIAPFWRIRGHYREGERWLGAVLASDSSIGSETKALVLLGASEIAFARGDYARARATGEKALAMFRELGDLWGAAEALNRLGLTAWEQGDPDAAVRLHEESLQLREAMNDAAGMGASLGNLGTVAHSRGDLHAAKDYFERSLVVLERTDDALTLAIEQGNLGAILMDLGELDRADRMFLDAQDSFRRLGDTSGEAFVISNRGLLALARDDPREARRHLEAALEACRDLEEPQNVARALYCLADVALYEGDTQRALPLASEALEIFARLDHGQGVTFTLEAVACSLAKASPAVALRLFGASERLREERDITLADTEKRRHERYVRLAGNGLERSRVESLLVDGKVWSRDEAMRMALDTAWEARRRPR